MGGLIDFAFGVSVGCHAEMIEPLTVQYTSNPISLPARPMELRGLRTTPRRDDRG